MVVYVGVSWGRGVTVVFKWCVLSGSYMSSCLSTGLCFCLCMICVPNVLWLTHMNVCDLIFNSWLYREHYYFLHDPGFLSTQKSS